MGNSREADPQRLTGAAPHPVLLTGTGSAKELGEKLAEYNDWITNMAELDRDTVKQYRNEIKLKGRNFIKFHAEVKLLNDEDLIAKFSTLMTEFRNVRDIANGRVPKPKAVKATNAETESKAQVQSSSLSLNEHCSFIQSINIWSVSDAVP